MVCGSCTRSRAPSPSSALTMRRAGDSRMSSVPPLKAKPSTASFFLALQNPNGAPHLLHKQRDPLQVDMLHFLQQPAINSMLLRQKHEGAKILGETVASETNASVSRICAQCVDRVPCRAPPG